jgi:hypothetical protein
MRTHATSCEQARDFLQSAGGSVGTVGRRDSVDLGGDGRDALVRNAEFACDVHCLGPVQVDSRVHATEREATDPVGQPVAVSDRLGPEVAQVVGGGRRSRPDHPGPREQGELNGEHSDPDCRSSTVSASRSRAALGRERCYEAQGVTVEGKATTITVVVDDELSKLKAQIDALVAKVTALEQRP